MTVANGIAERYTEEQLFVIQNFFEKLAKCTRKSGKILGSKKQKIMEEWEGIDEDVVILALNTYLSMNIEDSKYGKGKNERYVKGIMLNKQLEKSRVTGGNNGRFKTDSGKGKNTVGEDEGARLQQFITKGGEHSLQCDF